MSPIKSSALGGLLAAALLAAAPVARADVTLVVSSWVPPSHLLTRTTMRWCDEVTKATASRVKCNLLPKGVAGPQGAMDAVRDGVADLGFAVHGYTPGRFPLTAIAELPFLGDSAEAVSVAYQRVHERHLAKAGEHKGVKVLAVFAHGPGEIYNIRRPVNSLADMQGLKWRTGGGSVNDVGKAIGANVTLKPSTETYELLSTGVMDGVFFPPESIDAFRLDRIVRHRTRFPGGLYNTSFAFFVNEAVWNRIPKADQQAIERLSGEHAARMFGRAWDAADRRGLAVMQASGVQSVQANTEFVSQVKARTQPLERRWLDDAKARGVADPEKVLREFRADAAKG